MSWLLESSEDEESGKVSGCWIQKCGALEFCMTVGEGRTTLKQ